MPSPFPGMDPYLEDPVLWQGVHQGLISSMRAELNSFLPPNYVADMGERLYVLEPGRSIYPDVFVMERTIVNKPKKSTGAPGSVATCDPPVVLTVEPEQIREVFIEILSLKPERHIIAIIEVLSPSNKMAGSEGREQYRKKQSEVLGSDIHLIEIDLLRHGEHTVAIPYQRLRERATWDYLVSLHRGQGKLFGRFEFWAVTLQQRLPRILVPLGKGDPDVVLDLQAVFSRCYDEGAYQRQVDYRSDPPMPLGPEGKKWAATLLNEMGLK